MGGQSCKVERVNATMVPHWVQADVVNPCCLENPAASCASDIKLCATAITSPNVFVPNALFNPDTYR